jgi:hypothetical protein
MFVVVDENFMVVLPESDLNKIKKPNNIYNIIIGKKMSPLTSIYRH